MPVDQIERPVVATAAIAAAERALAAAGSQPTKDMWTEARARCTPAALTASWQYGRALAGGAGAWAVARSRLDAVYALRDAWEAATAPADDQDDYRDLPDDLHQEIEAAERGLLTTPAPHWQGIADKLRLLLPFTMDEVWEDGWTPNPRAAGFAGALARLWILAEGNGTGDVSGDYSLMSALAAEDLAQVAAHHSSGYQCYGCNPRALADMALIVTTIHEDARRLCLTLGQEHDHSLAFQAVWFPDQFGEAGVQ